jgi:hypothetical protein
MTEKIEKTDETVKLGADLTKSSLDNGKEVNLEKAEFYKDAGNKAFKGSRLNFNFYNLK